MSRTSRGARTLASSPGITQSTPLGLALAEETFAIRREMPPKLLRARGAGLRLLLPYLSAKDRKALPRKRKRHPCQRGRWFWWWQAWRHANCRRKAIERTARNRVEFWSSRGTPPARVALSLSRVSPARHYNEACKNGFRRVPHGRSPLPEPLVP